MKYKLFRSPGNLDKAIRKHELVAVETGKNIDDVADALIRAVRDDLAEMPEYAHCETACISYHCPSFLSIGLSILPEICSLGTQSSLVRQCSDTKLQFHR